jgi:cytochrome c biogenesis protein
MTFKVRDAQGQAREYQNYMHPITLEGRPYLLSGMRATPSEDFRYLRIPLDEDGDVVAYMQWVNLMQDASRSGEIASRYANLALQDQQLKPDMREQFEGSVTRLLSLFGRGGYSALADFVSKSVPEAEREKAALTYVRILEGAALEAYIMSREAAPKPVVMDEAGLQFVRDGMNAMSDSVFYGAPFYLQLADFQQRQASGFQLTRSPGKNLVYGGSLLLVLGIFAMFYIHERRLWLLVKPGSLLLAMSATRKSRDFDAEFSGMQVDVKKLINQDKPS